MDDQKNLSAPQSYQPPSVRVASIQVESAQLETRDGVSLCKLRIRNKDGEYENFGAAASNELSAVAEVVTQLCIRPVSIVELRTETIESRSTDSAHSDSAHSDSARSDSARSDNVQHDKVQQYISIVEEQVGHQFDRRSGVSRFASDDKPLGVLVSTLRAASNAGLLKAAYRANNQKFLRSLARELVEEQFTVLGVVNPGSQAIDDQSKLEAEAVALKHLNRAASAAVVTATNHPNADSILSLFDTSAWLFNHRGQRRDAYTDTNLWLAWYPGLKNDDAIVGDVVDTMPVAPDIKIPWVVRLFENPKGWLRFRGSVDLQDHDVLHILLGRGLQDQDEAFVVGFAMGTAKKTSAIQFRVLKFALTYLYPEPYRIPKYLQPAFRLGFECGRETGVLDLYRQSLKELRTVTVREARDKLKIDVAVLQKYYEQEQQKIPFTIASLRLP